MAPRKEIKNQDSFIEESNPNEKILSDTTARLVDVTKSWK